MEDSITMGHLQIMLDSKIEQAAVIGRINPVIRIDKGDVGAFCMIQPGVTCLGQTGILLPDDGQQTRM